MKRIKISNHQLFSLTVNYTCGAAIIVISSGVTALAKKDAWISVLLTVVIGMFDIWLMSFLAGQYQNRTFIEMIEQIFGKFIGRIVACGFIFYCLELCFQMPWYIGNFMTIHAMPETPEIVINLIFIIVIVIAELYGIETIARASEIFIYVFSSLFILTIILVLPNAKIDNLLPVFEKGFAPALKGTLLLLSSLTFPVIALMMIYPFYTSDAVESKKSFFKGYLFAGLMYFLSITTSILVLGSTITASSKYSIFLLAKEINLGIIFNRLEFIVAIVWIITLLTKGIVYFHSCVIGISQLLGLKDYKKIVLPFGLIVLVMSEVVFSDSIYQANWVKVFLIPFSVTFGFILPLSMVIVFIIKKFLAHVKDA